MYCSTYGHFTIYLNPPPFPPSPNVNDSIIFLPVKLPPVQKNPSPQNPPPQNPYPQNH